MNKSSLLPQITTHALAVAVGSGILLLIYAVMWHLTLGAIALASSADTYDKVKVALTYPIYTAICIFNLAVTQGLRFALRAAAKTK